MNPIDCGLWGGFFKEVTLELSPKLSLAKLHHHSGVTHKAKGCDTPFVTLRHCYTLYN